MGWPSIQPFLVNFIRYEVRLHVLYNEIYAYQMLQSANETMEKQANSNVLPRWDFHHSCWSFRHNRASDYKVSFDILFDKSYSGK